MDQTRETNGILYFRVLLYTVFLYRSETKLVRLNKYPIDRVEFKFEILKHTDWQRVHEKSPENGCFHNGLYLEGAS